MDKMQKLDEILKTYEEEMTETLRGLVRIPSVDGEPLPGKPFGEACARALDYALKKAESFGFETYNDENYAGHVALGGTPEGKTLGILAHLDVVPEGSDWTVPPYEGVIRDGFLYGRGANDNKCSCVSCLFALRAIREAGIPLRDRVLLILGCNEEKGSADMAHYMQHVGMPDYGFSPDSGFPVCYAEKGIHRMEIRGAFGGATPLISLAAGQAVNIVPNRCRACVQGAPEQAEALRERARQLEVPCKIACADGKIDIEVEGVAAHGAFPAGGRNAIALLAEILSCMDLGAAEPALRFVREKLGVADWDGKGLGIQMEDEPSGALTVNLGVVRADEAGIALQLDIRQPVAADFADVLARVQAACAPYGLTARSTHVSPALYVAKDSWLVTTLMRVYKEMTGRDDEPFSMGGGTYARSMKNAVAFGPGLPGNKSGGAHGPDEKQYLPEMFEAARIYAHTIVALAGPGMPDPGPGMPD